MSNFSINGRNIGPGEPCLIIGEVAQGHDGNINVAHDYIDAIAKAGAGAVKFQTHIAEAESSDQEPWRVKFSTRDATRFDYWKRMEFSETQWGELKTHADEKGLVFLSSPFSPEAMDLLLRIGIPAWKVASGEMSNPQLLDKMAKTGLPVLLSSGMSGWDELDAAAQLVRDHNSPLAVFQCTSDYPTPPEKTGLNVLGELAARYDCPVGLSDHSGKIYSGISAVALGATLLEVHVTFSREDTGPDVPSSVTTAELEALVAGVSFVETALAHPVDKDAESRRMEPLRELFTKSVVAVADIPAGSLIAGDQLGLRKPGTGIPATELDSLIGRTARESIPAGTFINLNQLETKS